MCAHNGVLSHSHARAHKGGFCKASCPFFSFFGLLQSIMPFPWRSASEEENLIGHRKDDVVNVVETGVFEIALDEVHAFQPGVNFLPCICIPCIRISPVGANISVLCLQGQCRV